MFFFIKISTLVQAVLINGKLQTCKSNKCNENADCFLLANNKNELKPFCSCKPGYYGDGTKCEPKFTLVIELCRNEARALIFYV